MSDVVPLNGTQSSLPVNRPGRTPAAGETRPAGRAPVGDKVEVSVVARMLAKMAELPDVRHDLVDRVKHEIEAGTYETPDKLDAALDELAQDVAPLPAD